MRKFLIIVLIVLFALISIIGCKGKAKLDKKTVVTFLLNELYYADPNNPDSEMKTKEYGKISFYLYTNDSEDAVKLFIKAVKSGFYNPKINGDENVRFRFHLNDPAMSYFMQLKFILKDNKFDSPERLKTKWSKEISPSSNIPIKRGTLALNAKLKSDFVVLKIKQKSKDLIPIGQVTPDSV